MPNDLNEEQRLKVATARAARLSYLTFDGVIDLNKDYELHDRLKESGHWSPFEHCAQACQMAYKDTSNFRGWLQYRKTFPNEHRQNVDLKKIAESRPSWITI